MRGTLKKCLLGLLDTLGDRRGNFLRLAVADADETVTVTDDHEGGEAEATATLHDLGDTVDRHDALDVDRLLSLATTVVASATVTRATAALSALGSAHEMCSISKVCSLVA